VFLGVWPGLVISAVPDGAFDSSYDSCSMQGACSETVSLLQVAVQKLRQQRHVSDDDDKDPPSLPQPIADALKPLPSTTTTTLAPEAVVGSGGAAPAGAEPVDTEPDPNGADIKTCTAGRSGCKSMCRWLKLVDQDVKSKSGSGSSCPLYEWSLKTCGYIPPEDRPEGSHTDPIDCSTKIIRKAVFWPELESMVDRLDSCIQGLPASTNATCGVALTLVTNEISDLKEEMALKKAASAARRNLQEACGQARHALESKTDEQAAIDALAGNLSLAENISGHYLTEDLHVARDFLDRLGPIPPARDELETSMLDARMALSTKDVEALNNAIVRLNISVAHAAELQLFDAVVPSQKVLDALLVTRARVVEFQTIMFEANVSLATRSKMPPAIVALKSGIDNANSSNLTEAVPRATELLDRLIEANNALKDLKWAIHHGSVTFDDKKAGVENLEEALRWLNTSFSYATSIRVTTDETTSKAVEMLDKLEYVYDARVALHKAVALGQAVLRKDKNVLNDDSEEAAIELLEPAIKWGYEVELADELPQAQVLSSQLESVERSKENMVQALSEGNASLAAKQGEESAIQALSDAMHAEQALGVQAGFPAGDAESRLLNARKLAKENLRVAIAAATRCLRTQKGTAEAVNLLNHSVTETNITGLVIESDLAYQQMMGLLKQQEARQELQEALKKADPRVEVKVEPLNDTQPVVVVNRTGAEVVHLPLVNNSKDDGDADFDEHIRVLEIAIAKAKAMGVIDPDMEMRLEHIRAMKNDFHTLLDAVRAGNHSWISKEGVSDSIELLTTAISESLADGLVLGVAFAKKLLGVLIQIDPAMDEYEAALVQGNMSLRTVSHMSAAILRLQPAIEMHEKLQLKTDIPLSTGKIMISKLVRVKQAYVDLKASLVAGQVALKNEDGEEAAMNKLESAINDAKSVGLERDMPVAIDLLQELVHMNEEHQKMSAVVGT